MIKQYSDNQVQYVIRYAHINIRIEGVSLKIIYAKHMFDALRVRHRLFTRVFDI